MLFLYQLIGYILIPIIKININLRINRGKEDGERYLERFGITSIKRPKGDLIWIHAASVGEFKSASIIINSFHNKFNILVTTTTLSAAKYAIENYGNKIIHQYAPIDIKKWVKKFLLNWKPQITIWIESDLWPITLNLIKKNSINSIGVNLRISPKSYQKWIYLKFFYKNMINCFDLIFAQSQKDKIRIEKLINKKVKYIGNLKLAYVPNHKHDERFHNFNKHKVLMLASTHKNEEKLFLEFINRKLLEFDDLKIIIAPRHPERAVNILNIFKKNNIKSNIITKSKKLDEKVLIVDSFGKMPLYFSLSDIVFLGGSLVKMGGHNPIEPAKNNCVIITGPYIHNWEDIFNEMKNLGACSVLNNVNEIDNYFTKIYNDIEKMEIIKNKAKNFSKKNFFDTEKLFNSIKTLMNYN